LFIIFVELEYPLGCPEELGRKRGECRDRNIPEKYQDLGGLLREALGEVALVKKVRRMRRTEGI